MSDLIERKNAIEVLAWHMYDVALLKADGRLDTMDSYRKSAEIAMRHIPSADRPRGEWIEQEDDYHHYWECSECGMGVGLDDIRNFCPNCGAKMKGADDNFCSDGEREGER